MSRAAEKWGAEWVAKNLSDERRSALIQLNEVARSRGQSLAQMALAWILRFPSVTSALIGASSVRQIEENITALQNLHFTADELKRIDELTAPSPVNQ